MIFLESDDLQELNNPGRPHSSGLIIRENHVFLEIAFHIWKYLLSCTCQGTAVSQVRVLTELKQLRRSLFEPGAVSFNCHDFLCHFESCEITRIIIAGWGMLYLV